MANSLGLLSFLLQSEAEVALSECPVEWYLRRMSNYEKSKKIKSKITIFRM